MARSERSGAITRFGGYEGEVFQSGTLLSLYRNSALNVTVSLKSQYASVKLCQRRVFSTRLSNGVYWKRQRLLLLVGAPPRAAQLGSMMPFVLTSVVLPGTNVAGRPVDDQPPSGFSEYGRIAQSRLYISSSLRRMPLADVVICPLPPARSRPPMKPISVSPPDPRITL